MDAEWHKSGHGLHAHFAVGRYIGRRKIEQAWGRGFVHIKLLGDLPVESTSLHEARLAARYLSKYVSKTSTPHGRRGCTATRSPRASNHGWEVAEVYVDDDTSAYSGKVVHGHRVPYPVGMRPAGGRAATANDMLSRDSSCAPRPTNRRRLV